MSQSLGEKIKRKRKENSLTQQELADSIGVNVQTIRSYESGKYRPKTKALHEMARLFNCSIYDLVDDWSGFTVDEQKDIVLFGGQKAAMNAMYDLLDLEEKKKVDIYVSDMLTIHNYNADKPQESKKNNPDV